MPDTHQWMIFPPTGGTNRFPVEAVPDWVARGWEPCDPPPEVDLTNTVLVDGVEPAPTGEPDAAEDTTADTAGPAGEPDDTNPDADNADDTEEAVTHG